MAVSTGAVTVSTSATLLAGIDASRMDLAFVVPGGGATVYVGGSDVTTANGFPVPAGTPFSVSRAFPSALSSSMAWYGIVAAGTEAVRVLKVTQ